jgi:hypothetical protein
MNQTTRYILLFAGLAVLLACGGAHRVRKVALPRNARLYHGVYPGGKTGAEDDITPQVVDEYENLVGQPVAWVYFSDNWFHQRTFPLKTATWIRQRGAVPFIRLMLRSSAAERQAEPLFTLQAIIDGQFDPDLRTWAQGARAFGSPLLVEWGTECNGEWFPWNGKWNGGAEKGDFGDPEKAAGPQRFVAAYRHIVQIMRDEGADNLTWVFHVNSDDAPDQDWNHFENYYPGDDVVDWVGVSCYGPLTPQDQDDPSPFREELDDAYPRLRAMAPHKPIMVLEFGCTGGNPRVQPDLWAQAALTDLLGGRWPKVRGFSWWNEHWENDDTPAHDTTMRVQDLPALAQVFHDQLAAHAAQLQTRPVYR